MNKRMMYSLISLLFIFPIFVYADTSSQTEMDISWSLPAGFTPLNNEIQHYYQFFDTFDHQHEDGKGIYEGLGTGWYLRWYNKDADGKWPVLDHTDDAWPSNSYVEQRFYLSSFDPATGGSGYMKTYSFAQKPDTFQKELVKGVLDFQPTITTYVPVNDPSQYWTTSLNLTTKAVVTHSGPIENYENNESAGLLAQIQVIGESSSWWGYKGIIAPMNDDSHYTLPLNPYDPNFDYKDNDGKYFPANFTPTEVRQSIVFMTFAEANEYGASVNPAPEPISALLFAAGGGAMAYLRREKYKF